MQGHFNPHHHQVQHHHHHIQQQLAALLSAALPQTPAAAAATGGDSDCSYPAASASEGSGGGSSSNNASSDSNESSRVGALESLRRTIHGHYPLNSLVVSHSASFLSHGLFQLLSDKSYVVRRAAAVAYGCLCAVVASTSFASNGLPNHVMTSGIVERFISWALPLLGGIGSRNRSTEMALESLYEFLNTGDASSIERYVPSILKACQELLEHERTSMSLLRQLLALLTLISGKFENCLQPHFVDIVDVLLGWAFMPELSDVDRCIITDSFLQFRKQWLSNLHFTIGLLSKFLGDMEILIQDANLEIKQQSRRLLALFSCFSTVLQVTASGILEMDLPEQISESIENISSRLLKFVLSFGNKFGWPNRIEQSWSCLIFLAEILKEKFSDYYSMAINILFQSLRGVPSSQVLGLMKTNMKLLSLQKLALMPSSVRTFLQFDSPLSQLRLHPNHLIVASSAATYLFFLQHACDRVVSQAVRSLLEELELLKDMLGEMHCLAVSSDGLHVESELDGQFNTDLIACKHFSETELLSLIKFDLKMLACSVSGDSAKSSLEDTASRERLITILTFMLEKLNPFEKPVQGCLELQVRVISTLHKLSEVEFFPKLISLRKSSKSISVVSDSEDQSIEIKNGQPDPRAEYLMKYSNCLVRALDGSLPIGVKLEALNWICSFGRMVSNMNKDADLIKSCNTPRDVRVCSDLLFLILNAAYDREVHLRSHVATTMEILLHARLIDAGDFCIVSSVALDKLSDPDMSIRNIYERVLSIILPLAIYSYGLVDDRDNFNLQAAHVGNVCYSDWRQVLALKQMPRKLHSQQLVSILSYISQRWKVPLSSWIQRLVFSCREKMETTSGLHDIIGDVADDGLQKDAAMAGDMLDKMFPVSNLAAVWWSIHEAARYCTSLRLRTNLGGPTQTFAALERMLLDIPNVILQDTEQCEGKYIGSYNFHLLPMRLLLEFVEALKKNVYNAYEGSCVLPCSPRQSSLFFRANKKVCEEWFSRICEPMMNAGLTLHCHDATLHYCALRLQDLGNLSASAFSEKSIGAPETIQNIRPRLAADVLKVLRYASLTLCRRHESEALVGLQKWATMTFPFLLEADQVSQGVAACSGHLSWMNGLVYQAQGHYEKAAAYFSHLLQSEEALSAMGSDGVQFAIARVIESYTSLSDWKSLEIWLAELQSLRALHAGKTYSGALTAAGNELNAIHALGRFDEGDIYSAWGYLDLTPKSSNELTLDPKVALERSEQMLLRSMLQWDSNADKMSEDVTKAKVMLEEGLSLLPLDGLTEAAACAVQLHCINAFEEGTRSNGLDKPNWIIGSLNQVLHSPIRRNHQDCSLWIKVFRVYRTVMPTSLVTLLLCDKLLSLARKQNNFILAVRMHKHFKDHLLKHAYNEHMEFFSMKLQYEGILLRYAEGKHEDALIDLWSFVCSTVLSSSFFASHTSNVVKAKACLKLSTWLRREKSNIKLSKVLSRIREDFSAYNASEGSYIRPGLTSADGNLISDANQNMILEEIMGATTKISCSLCPGMGKAWLSYSSWCFNQANVSLALQGTVLRSCSLSPVLNSEVSPVRLLLTEEEMSKVKDIIHRMFLDNTHVLIENDVDTEHPGSTLYPKSEAFVNSFVQQTVYLMQAAAGAPGLEASNDDCPSSALVSQLQVLFLCMDTNMKKSDIMPFVDELVGVWWSLRRRRVALFGHAARGYFQYLSLSSSKQHENYHATYHPVDDERKGPSSSLRSMLYLLHILLNYGVELNDTFEHGFATVPLLPWQEIAPQLFARLSSHPKETVRKQLEALLILLAKLSPWSIVYPLLVDINAYEGGHSKELQRILDYLAKLYPKLIEDVQLVINCLGTITVLWEEQWLNTLQDLRTDVIRRIHMLKEEVARIAENSTLSHTEKKKINAAKYSAMMAPIIVALERRFASTSREPTTAHEGWFCKEYGQQLKSAILAFKTPPVSAAALGDVWRPFDTIATSLATYQRKQSIYLSEVAPQLASLSSSDVPMPGLEKQNLMLSSSKTSSDVQGIITISSFCEQVTILPTKTKPKKLVLLGSDGQKYTYLLKGREDLRLDARIMQILQAVNSFLSSCSDTPSQSLAIRYYSVTPISGRAGLIQWVDNVTSIYSIYKSWQIREQLAQLAAASAGNSKITVPPVPRPSDMFYGKIIPALKEKGIRRVISRRDWPHEVKRKVLLDLMKDTPRELLWREMWCASEGFKGFSSRTKRFSGSVAVMSMVGHILGLGDRHLDNILMDFRTGDVIHIDYNVCFDKGKRLKIPEIVPFRLTQTLETALGLTGIEGSFRANCETVIDILRKNKDILLMLLEVFVWDPLVDWTRGDDHDEAAIGGEEKKGMELAVSLSLFASRFQEIRIPLQEHHDLLVSTLPAAESSLRIFLDVLNKFEVVSTIFYHADNDRSALLQHETTAKSIVAEATSVSEKSQTAFDAQAHEFSQAKAVAAEKAQEASTWVDQHQTVLDALRNGSLPEAQFFGFSGMEDVLSLASAVLVSGVPLTIVPEPTQAQCSDLDREVRQLINELGDGLSSAIEALREYAFALQRVLPLNYITTSPVNSWAHILQLSVNNLSGDTLSLAKRQAADLMAKAQGNDLDSVQHRHYDLFQRMERYATHIQNLEDECSGMMTSVGSDTESKSKERLLSAFTKYMQSAGYSSKENDLSVSRSGQPKYDAAKDSRTRADLDMKKTRVLLVLRMAANELYKEVKDKVLNLSDTSAMRVGWAIGDVGLQHDSGNSFCEFEEKIEKCGLVAGFVSEVEELIGLDLASPNISTDTGKDRTGGTWVSIFQASLHSCKTFLEQMTEVVLPEIMRSIISSSSEAMDAFGILSQIRGSIDTAIEKLVEVEIERASLVELEKTYFVKVDLISEQQLALEEASMKGRDHLSWEEAEELATQEEACRAQLEQLHQSWNQKDVRITSIAKIEAHIKNSLISSEQYFSSLTNIKREGDLHIQSSRTLLSALVKPFSDLELVDHMLSSEFNFPLYLNESSFSPSDLMSSGSSLSESMWGFAKLLKSHSFFIWKIGIMDFILDSCIHDISSSVDHNFGFDQLYGALKKKLEIHLQEYVGHYLKKKVAPALISQLETQDENLQHMLEVREDIVSDQVKADMGATRRVQLMLEEFCNAHETAMAARSAISVMKRQVSELTDALCKTVLEIVQMEWLHDTSLPHLLEPELLPKNILDNDKLPPLVLTLRRSPLLEKIQTSMSSIRKSLDYLQACERTSVSAEGQLERAMGWACGGPNTFGHSNSSIKSSGIPSEFHDHLLRRKQFLQVAQEQACDVIKVCTSVMEYEASRDGLFRMPVEKSSGRTIGDGRAWRQAYLSALTRLDVAYHSFTLAEEEWKLAQTKMEAAANVLFSATNELLVASGRAKAASGDLQDTLVAMRDHAYEASSTLSAFGRVSKGHTALTSECGSMLEEVLAISEGLHDVYSLGKEAAAVHNALMEDLSKANKILLPLEASLANDVDDIAVAIPKERESNADVPPVHGQALYQSYRKRLQDACQSLMPLVPSIINYVKDLHTMLTNLARSSSMHAGNLHKALEGLGESQVVRSQDLNLSRTELSDNAALFENKEKRFRGSNGSSIEDLTAVDNSSLQDDEWVSPPEYTFTSSLDSCLSLIDESLPDASNREAQLQHGNDSGDGDMCDSFPTTNGPENAYIVKPESECMEDVVTTVPSDRSGSVQASLLLHNDLLAHSGQLYNVEREKANDLGSSNVVKEYVHGHDEPYSFPDPVSRNTRGKNPYALSVLRQVEMKLDGREMENTSSMEIAEQVDRLLKQATSVDNLCNMYEGWTPWI